MTIQFDANKLLSFSSLTAILFFIILFNGCIDERIENDAAGADTTITFSVKVSDGFVPVTYSDNSPNEGYLHTIDVVVFDEAGKYVSGPHQGVIDGTQVSVSIVGFNRAHNMSVFANCRSVLDEKAPSFQSLASRASISESLVVGSTSTWHITGEGNVPIPMWGEFDGGGEVRMIRMLTKIDVINRASTFDLTDVFLCNYSNEGFVAPLTGSLPSVPPNAQQTSFEKAIHYTSVSDNACLNTIYTFEAAAGKANDSNNPCIIVGGIYGGEMVYYRLDFVNGQTYFGLLRNCGYNVVIDRVTDRGHPSAAQAFASLPMNVDYNIGQSDDGSMGDVIYDGQYFLSVSQRGYMFSKSARDNNSTDNKLTITTNYPNALSVVSDSESWLTVSTQGDAEESGSQRTFTYLLMATANSAAPRVANVALTAGNMQYNIDVVQSNADTDLLIDGSAADKSLLFTSHTNKAAEARTISVGWLPVSESVHFAGSGNFERYALNGIVVPHNGSLSSVTGSRKVAVQPMPVDDWGAATPTKTQPIAETAEAKIVYTLPVATNDIVRTLTLKQQVWDFFFIEGTDASGSEVSTLSIRDSNGAAGEGNITLSLPEGATIVWTPEGATATYFDAPVLAGSSSATTQTYSIRAKSLAESSQMVSGSFRCAVTYKGHTAEKTLYLQHRPEVSVNTDAAYPMDGGTYILKFDMQNTTTTTLHIDLDDNDNKAIANIPSTISVTNGSGSIAITTNDYRNSRTVLRKDVTLTLRSADGSRLIGSAELCFITPEPEANSYIVSSSNTRGILIPVSRIGTFENEVRIITSNDGKPIADSNFDWFADNDPFTAEWVWKDNRKMTVTATPVGQGLSGYVKVTAIGAREGNTVVAAMQGGVIRWSWHVWVTDYDPGMPAEGTFMDRNLGAWNDIVSDTGSFGLVYQWGRKDPFPGHPSIDGVIRELEIEYGIKAIADMFKTGIGKQNIVNMTTKSTYNPPTRINGVANNIDYTVVNPHIFYSASSGLFDWYISGVINDEAGRIAQNNSLWGGYHVGVKNKTVFDPCPAGWRVPRMDDAKLAPDVSGEGYVWSSKNSPWSAVNNNNKGTFDLGHIWDKSPINYGGYYPAAGCRHGESGNFVDVGLGGYYWSSSAYATTDSRSAGNLYFFSRNVNAASSSTRASGLSVRCVRGK